MRLHLKGLSMGIPEKVAGQTQPTPSAQHSTKLMAQKLIVEQRTNLPENEKTSSLRDWKNGSLILLGIAILTLIFIYGKNRQRSPQSLSKFSQKHTDITVEKLRYILCDLVKGIEGSSELDRAKGLVTEIHRNNPDRTEKWCVEKALEDVLRDRNITGLAHLINRYNKQQIIQESLILPSPPKINKKKIVTSTNKAPESIANHPNTSLIDIILNDMNLGKYQTKPALKNKLTSSIDLGKEEEFQESLKAKIINIEQEITKTKYDERKKNKLKKYLKNAKLLQDVTNQLYQFKTKTEEINELFQNLIVIANPEDQLLTLVKTLKVRTLEEIKGLAELLKKEPIDRLQSWGAGLSRGLILISKLQPHLTIWIQYKPIVLDDNITLVGKTNYNLKNQGYFFASQSPWQLWSEHIDGLSANLFTQQNNEESAEEFYQFKETDLSDWIELILVLNYLPLLLVKWLDQQAVDSKSGKILANRTLISFALICCELAKGFGTAKISISEGAKQLEKVFLELTWQFLETLSNREDFPFFNGVMISLSGKVLRDTLKDIDAYLKKLPPTQTKDRLLTLLAHYYSIKGNYSLANDCAKKALDITQKNRDKNSKIANLNHLFYNNLKQENYEQAIKYSRDILDISRQTGNLLIESNGLINLGYTKILKAQKLGDSQTEIKQGIKYIDDGLDFLKKSDNGNYKYCMTLPLKIRSYSYLGRSYLLLKEPELALEYLEKSQKLCGRDDLYLRGINFTYLGKAYFKLNKLKEALLNSFLGKYYLNKVKSFEIYQAEKLIETLKK